MCSEQFFAHLSTPGSLQEKFIGGATKTILNWCHATGNLTRKMARHTHICHLPKVPILFWTMSVPGTAATVTKKNIYKLNDDKYDKRKKNAKIWH